MLGFVCCLVPTCLRRFYQLLCRGWRWPLLCLAPWRAFHLSPCAFFPWCARCACVVLCPSLPSSGFTSLPSREPRAYPARPVLPGPPMCGPPWPAPLPALPLPSLLRPLPCACPSPPRVCFCSCLLPACLAAFISSCAGAGCGCCPGSACVLLWLAPCAFLRLLLWGGVVPFAFCFSFPAGGWLLPVLGSRCAINDGNPAVLEVRAPGLLPLHCLLSPARACMSLFGWHSPGARHFPCPSLRPIGQPVLLCRLPPLSNLHLQCFHTISW